MNTASYACQLRRAVYHLRRGGVIAYPTEAVYGLGCDPAKRCAVLRLLKLKQRSPHKGLILVAADFAQLAPYIKPLSSELREQVLASWPGRITWLLPARRSVPSWLRGKHDSLAVRVSSHPLVAALCRQWRGALVSTSANRSGRRSARNAAQVRQQFRDSLDYILNFPTGGAAAPSEIRDALSGRVVRGG